MAANMPDDGLDQLSVEDRLALAQQLWDSVADEVSRLPLTRAQQQEVDRRPAGPMSLPTFTPARPLRLLRLPCTLSRGASAPS
jgi:hypothetical protein